MIFLPRLIKKIIHINCKRTMSMNSIAEKYLEKNKNIKYNTIALSSLGENYSQIFTLFNTSEIDENWFDEYDKIHYSLENKLIKLNNSPYADREMTSFSKQN